MDDISSLIGQILNDPDQLQQIMDIASSISDKKAGSQEAPFSPEKMEELGAIIRQTQQTDPKQDALVHALRPYLTPIRRSKLDRALQIAKLSHLAGIALKRENDS